MNNEENTPFVDANLRKAYLEGLRSPDWQTNPYESPLRAAYDSGRAERARRRLEQERQYDAA